MGQRQALRVSAKLVSVAIQNAQLNPGLRLRRQIDEGSNIDPPFRPTFSQLN
jgi:hypothetical protein